MKKLLSAMFAVGMFAALGVTSAPQASASRVDTGAPSVVGSPDAEPEILGCIPSVCALQGGYCCHPTVCCVR